MMMMTTVITKGTPRAQSSAAPNVRKVKLAMSQTVYPKCSRLFLAPCRTCPENFMEIRSCVSRNFANTQKDRETDGQTDGQTDRQQTEMKTLPSPFGGGNNTITIIAMLKRLQRGQFWWLFQCTGQIGMVIQITVKPVYNDHLMGYFSAFWSSSRWPRAT